MFERHNITALFAGIGGLELGLHGAGHTTTLFCERDPEAVSVLRHRFPSVPIALDVRDRRDLIAKIHAQSNLITAGFPCTDLSQAGRMAGLDGLQSGLIRDTLALLEERPFAHGLLENVPNWRSLDKGKHLDEVLRELERLGYRWAYRVIDSRCFGLPQRRERLVVYFTRDSDPREVLFHGSYEPSDASWAISEKAHGFYWTEGNKGIGWGENCVPTLKGGSTLSIPSPPAIVLRDGSIITPDIRDAERLQGFEPGWTDFEARDDLVGAGQFMQRRRWWLVGNSVNVRLSRWLGQRLADRVPYAGDQGKPLSVTSKLPQAAWFDGETRRGVDLTTWPVARAQEDLQEFLQHENRPLSLKAAAGFLGRLEKSSLRPKPGFLEALRAYVSRLRSDGQTSARTPPKPAEDRRPRRGNARSARPKGRSVAASPKNQGYSS